MTITALDIKLRQSQRLTDNADGGGRMVATEIVDGQMNNLFPDIGDEERTTGRTTLRKMFVHVDTPTTDVLKDAIGIIVNPPTDSHVNMCMFATGSYSDVRSDARDVVERYITKGVESRFVLMGDHFVGQQTISVYAQSDAPTPDVNDNLALSSSPDQGGAEQYIRVKSLLSRTTETFYDDAGAFERDVLVIELVTALLHNFFGQEPARLTGKKPATLVYTTNTVDAASYYSVKSLAQAAEPGDLTVQVGSPYVPIVPATTAETPVVDVLAGMGTISYVQAGPTDSLADNFYGTFAPGIGQTRFLGNPVVRGSVKVTAGSVQLTDDGSGNLQSAAVSPWGGSIDYMTGSVTISHSTGAGQSISIIATPAGPVSDQGYTVKTDITSNNQGYNYVLQLRPLPAPGTVTIDYRALGKWIRLTDNGTGQIVGNAGQGAGTVNYTTGSVVVTLGALPDLDSPLLCNFGTGVIATARAGDTDIKAPSLSFLLSNPPKPGTLSIAFQAGGSLVTASDDGAGSLIIGGVARGTVVYATGEVAIRPVTLPDSNSTLQCEYNWAAALTTSTMPAPDGNGVVSFSLPTVPVGAGSLHLEWLTSIVPADEGLGSGSLAARVVAKDDGAGNIVALSAGGQVLSVTLGTVDYASGAVTLKAGDISIPSFPVPIYELAFNGRYRYVRTQRNPVVARFSAGTLISTQWQQGGSSSTAASEEFTLPPVTLDLTPAISDTIVPGSVRFVFRGRTYVDRSGSLYYDVDPATGAGTFAGTLDYESGLATVSQWAPGGANSVTVSALLTRVFDPGISDISFRTTGAPLRAGAFTLRATTLNGEQTTATADVNGDVTGDFVRGAVDWESGAVDLRFGRYVAAAGNENEPWYSADNVVGNQVWKPYFVIASTIYFGTVVYRSIPLSSVVIGLDSIRLPSDGRVPAFKPGQTVLVHHTAQHDVATPTAGQVIDFGRSGIAQSEVRDSSGVPIDGVWYTQDLDAGRLTFSDPLNLAAYQLPVVIRERVEDRRLVAGVQITGEIQLNSGLTHHYPAGEALVSTALRLGEANGSLDLQARVENLFDQGNWANGWSDQLDGASAAGTYNDTDYPLLVTNADAITERWAIRFTSATQFEVIGETVGTIANGSTTADCVPVNPRTGEPYFTIRREGWGGGWSVGNAVRFNTIGGLAPIWMVRTTLPGLPEQMTDSFRFQVIGNIAGGAQ
ncbi:hypothetical protein [Pseudoxanthomonas sp. USHLN014]|uniref:hypothetical protein n=1 Tax=Pseudoxanthomonas sp. USHLN014 TaxID=3081297 RepID=UPI00301CE156